MQSVSGDNPRTTLSIKRLSHAFGQLGILISFDENKENQSERAGSVLIVSDSINSPIIPHEIESHKISESMKSLDSLEILLDLMGITNETYESVVNKVLHVEDFMHISDIADTKKSIFINGS